MKGRRRYVYGWHTIILLGDIRFDDERHRTELFENMDAALRFYEDLLK